MASPRSFFNKLEIYHKYPIDSKQPTCMASPSQDIPIIEGTPTTSDSPHVEDDSYLHLDIPYAIPHEEINMFRRITRAYARQIRAFPLVPFLPIRK
jgi:hypothetical protein